MPGKQRYVRPKEPTHQEIASAAAQSGVLRHATNVADLRDAHRCCWACGFQQLDDPSYAPERAHIVPHSGGGSNAPANYFLLCEICHREQPDTLSITTQLFWLANRENSEDRGFRLVSTMFAHISKYAEQLGVPPTIFDEFCKSHSQREIRFQQNPERGGAKRTSNQVANVHWTLFDAFVQFCRVRGYVKELDP